MNGILLIDKPAGWTSHDVTAKLRGLLRERRVGHSGTLDPMATGLLVVFLGRATRAVQFAEADEKEYLAGIRFGLSTDTLDITGRVLSETNLTVDRPELEAALQRFRGEISQLPPMYSAIKIDGQRLYKLARAGKEVERTPRRVTISSLEAVSGGGADYELLVRCSKGTYIRSLCADIGEALGCCAAMSSLRRLRAGLFSVKDAHTLEDVSQAASEGRAGELTLPADALFASLPELTADEFQENKCRCGASFETEAADGKWRVYSRSGEFLMLARAENGAMHTIKSFFEVSGK